MTEQEVREYLHEISHSFGADAYYVAIEAHNLGIELEDATRPLLHALAMTVRSAPRIPKVDRSWWESRWRLMVNWSRR